ncbi:MAG: hypothetical protein QMC98_02580 [Candidatus Thermoplasmatota archaeon]|nr:hypothetical protein [Candidatus Thermoplasmatota archaeon]
MKKIKKIVVPTLKRNGVVRAGIFGSFVKGRKSLLDLARLEIELEKKLWRKVEILTYSSVHPLLKERILKEEVVIL